MISLDDGIESASSLLLFSTFTSVFQICQLGLSKKQKKIVSCCCEGSGLKALFHPAFLARVDSWFAFVVAIFMAHENGDNKGKPRDDTCKACWMKQSL